MHGPTYTPPAAAVQCSQRELLGCWLLSGSCPPWHCWRSTAYHPRQDAGPGLPMAVAPASLHCRLQSCVADSLTRRGAAPPTAANTVTMNHTKISQKKKKHNVQSDLIRFFRYTRSPCSCTKCLVTDLRTTAHTKKFPQTTIPIIGENAKSLPTVVGNGVQGASVGL